MRKKIDTTNKPYNRCLSCPHRKVRCDGPRTAGLTLARWCEYMRDMKEINNLTNVEIAELSGISVKTIEKLMAQNTDQDIMRETARLIENAIIGSTSQYPCYLAFEEEHRPDDKMNDAMLELEAQKKIDFLLDQLAKVRTDNDNLWAENNRKSKMIDLFIDRQQEDYRKYKPDRKSD